MERLRLSTGVVTRAFDNGTTISASKLERPRKIPSSVAKHEAAHVVAAGEIVMATIIPSGDALGRTQPVKMTAAAAAAAEALGHDGTGYDMYLTEHILGVDPGVAKSAARSALSGRDEEIYEVATLLEERGTIGQSDVKEAKQNVCDRRQGIFPVEIRISTPEGKTARFTAKTFRHEVKIADLLKAA